MDFVYQSSGGGDSGGDLLFVEAVKGWGKMSIVSQSDFFFFTFLASPLSLSVAGRRTLCGQIRTYRT